MSNRKNNSKKTTNSSKKALSKWIRLIKKKPLVFLTPVLIVIIIILAIALITSGNSSKTAVTDTEQETTVAGEAAELSYPYDDSNWKMEMQTGFLTYDDPAYTCTTGLDVSEWSLDIDWEKVKNAGISFVICRVGYRGYGTGKFQFDEKLTEYLEGADKAGIKTGVYFVTQAINEEEAIEEANTVLDLIKDYNITMPIYIDSEANTGEVTRTDNLTKEQFTKNAVAFCKTVEEAGYRGGIYSNISWIEKNLDMSQLTDYDIWFANYANTPGTNIPFNVWQYSSTGHVDGLTTDADLNIRLEKN